MVLRMRLAARKNPVTEEMVEPVFNYPDIREIHVDFEKGVTRIRYRDNTGDHWGEQAHSDIRDFDWSENPSDLDYINERQEIRKIEDQSEEEIHMANQ